jgi:type I restriction enzyme R subunit
MNEAETRAEHIDPALKASGWGVVDGSRIKREYPITQGRIESHGKQGKALTADYVLIYRNTKLAVIEAKAWNEALTEGVAQAKNYAQKIAVRYTYSTNGQGIYAIDMQTGNEGEVAKYPTPDELWAMTYAEADAWRDRFAEVAYEDKGGSHPGRYYQDIAIERVLSAIANKKPRILLTLATGTGKTFIAFQIAWKLFNSRWNLSSMGPEANYNARRPRILFLADRNILADQAKNAFSAFPEDAMVRIDPAEMRKKGKVPKNGGIFFTIFQTFMASAGSATGKGAGQPVGKGTSRATIPVPELAEGCFGDYPQASAGSATGQGAGQPAGKGTSSATGKGTGQANRISDSELAELPEPSEGADNYMYILGCNDGSFYTGSTTNLRQRLEQHRCGEGAQYTKDRLPVKFLYCELYPRIEEAFAREKQVQGWSRMKKIALIKGDVGELKRLAQASAGSATGKGTGSATGQGAGQPAGQGAGPATIPVPELAEGCFGDYPPDFFDLIIIDECHRGGAQDESNWRGILEYFAPAVQLGLTATPKRRDNADTYAYFGEPVYIYSLKEGINDGFLVPFKVKQISTTLDQYVYTSDDRVIEGDIQTGKLYEEKDFNRTIEIKEREKKRVELFLKEINQKEKTIVFCATQLHALVVRDLINQMADCKDPNYCQRVTANDGVLGEQHLSDFKDNERSIPTILTTSQKLSTGVDARNIRNIVLMRPVNSMIEFKQIIGRGTRLFEGKFYFTVFDFVKAHELFMDPEWDGEPLAPEVCKTCNTSPCGCLPNEPKTCNVCQKSPCKCPKEPCKKCNQRPCICKKVKIKLADGKERTIQHMMITSYFHPDGTPITSADFMNLLLGKLPEFFKNEAELRTLWSVPDTRKKLLEGLAEKGFGREQLFEIQKLIDAEKSDIYDVLANVVYFKIPETREVRAAHAKVFINTHFNLKQKAFLDFVLEHYVSVGVEELDQEKLTPLLRLKYNNSINDAIEDLGKPEEIGKVFAGFQKYLYQAQA